MRQAASTGRRWQSPALRSHRLAVQRQYETRLGTLDAQYLATQAHRYAAFVALGNQHIDNALGGIASQKAVPSVFSCEAIPYLPTRSIKSHWV